MKICIQSWQIRAVSKVVSKQQSNETGTQGRKIHARNTTFPCQKLSNKFFWAKVSNCHSVKPLEVKFTNQTKLRWNEFSNTRDLRISRNDLLYCKANTQYYFPFRHYSPDSFPEETFTPQKIELIGSRWVNFARFLSTQNLMEYRWWFSKLIIISLTRAVIFQWKAQRCFYLQMNFSLLFLTAVCIFIHRDTAHVYGCCNC